jgi:RND family efflux transporter MFP subunit
MSFYFRLSALTVLPVLIAAFSISCATKSEGAKGANAPSQTIAIVPAARVARGSIASDLTLTGEFIPYQEIDVMAKEAGYIKSIRVDIGDRVHTGELLAELEIPEMQDEIAKSAAGAEAAEADIAAARGDLNRAKSAYDIADLSYKRILDVSKNEAGLIPQQEVDVARSKQLETSAQVAAAQSNLQRAQHKLAMAKAEQARWTTLQKYTVITAPFSGVITKRYANTGAMIQQGTSSTTQAMPVVRLSQNDLLRLILPVPESAVPGVRIGKTVDVTVNSLNRTFSGRVTRFANKIAMATRTMDAEVDVPNRDGILVPGMYAEVKLSLQQQKNTLTLPLDGIEGLGSPSTRAYVVDDSGRIHIVPVKTGLETDRRVQLLSGLKENQTVVVGRHTGLSEGEKVEARIAGYESASNQ